MGKTCVIFPEQLCWEIGAPGVSGRHLKAIEEQSMVDGSLSSAQGSLFLLLFLLRWVSPGLFSALCCLFFAATD